MWGPVLAVSLDRSESRAVYSVSLTLTDGVGGWVVPSLALPKCRSRVTVTLVSSLRVSWFGPGSLYVPFVEGSVGSPEEAVDADPRLTGPFSSL